MKHYYENNIETSDYSLEKKFREYYVGETSDIKALYKSISRNKSSDLCPAFSSFPKFTKQVYGLCIDEYNNVYIISSDTILYMIINGMLEEE